MSTSQSYPTPQGCAKGSAFAHWFRGCGAAQSTFGSESAEIGRTCPYISIHFGGGNAQDSHFKWLSRSDVHDLPIFTLPKMVKFLDHQSLPSWIMLDPLVPTDGSVVPFRSIWRRQETALLKFQRNASHVQNWASGLWCRLGWFHWGFGIWGHGPMII